MEKGRRNKDYAPVMDEIDRHDDGQINWGSISLGKRYEL
jgi:hypothetical protein